MYQFNILLFLVQVYFIPMIKCTNVNKQKTRKYKITNYDDDDGDNVVFIMPDNNKYDNQPNKYFIFHFYMMK